MQLPDEAPKLPKLPFLLGDGALLATAWYIASRSDLPLGPAPLLAIVGCVALGAILAAIPFLADYARKQEESLQERQNALEALSRTTATAAEQISIAASGLHTIADLTQKNLKAAEQLGPKLQDKINDFARRADEALVAENEALTQEVNTLRASDAEKLEGAADKVRLTATELTRLEAATHKHLAAVSETLARLPALAEEASRKAADIQSETARATLAQILTEIDIRVAAATTRLASAPPLPPATTSGGPASESLGSSTDLPPPAPAETPTEPKRKRPKPAPKEAPAEASGEPADAVATAPEPTPATPPEPGPEVEALAPAAPATETAAEPPPAPVVEPEVVSPPAAAPEAPAEIPVASEPESVPEPSEVAVEPVTPPEGVPSVDPDDAPLPPPGPDADAETAAPKPARKARKPLSTSAPPFIPGLLNSDAPLARPGGDFSSLDSGDEAPEEPAGPPIDRAISADGLTRLLATAYIGIGNKLYIRGDGPGLSWDKGVPLQFVSIGKWRWETADANASFSAKLYKNDQVECAALGALTLDPGQQTEVNAAF